MKDQAGLGRHIAIGTRNPTKLTALVELIPLYPPLRGLAVQVFNVSSGVSEQPMTIEETIMGAKNRALRAYTASTKKALFGIGLESGLMDVPTVGYMDVCVCVVHTEKIPALFSVGLSGAWKFPEHAMDLVLHEGLDMTQACVRAGISTNEKLGDAEGAIGVLTGGLVTRKDYTKQAIQMALVDAIPHLMKEQL